MLFAIFSKALRVRFSSRGFRPPLSGKEEFPHPLTQTHPDVSDVSPVSNLSVPPPGKPVFEIDKSFDPALAGRLSIPLP